MNLINVKGNTYIFDNPSVIGLYLLNSSDVVLIDTGIDSDTIKKVIKLINEKKWNIKYVINTHSHADHCGGNYYLKKHYDVKVYSSRLEKTMIEYPILEPAYLYGAYPEKKLRNKFLMAKSSLVDMTISEGEIFIENSKFNIVDLKGHSPEHIGVITEDDVFFVGDSVFPKKIIDKHNLLFLFDYANTIKSLDKLKNIKCTKYVFSHGGVFDDLSESIEYNVNILQRINDYIFNLLDEYRSIEEIHKLTVRKFNIREILPQFYLNKSVIKAHLTYLVDEGKIVHKIVDFEAKWKKA